MNNLKVKKITLISNNQDSEMLEMIYNAVDSYCNEKNKQIKIACNLSLEKRKGAKKEIKDKSIKFVSFPHKIFLEIFNNVNFSIIVNFNFNNISIFNYPNILKNIDIVEQIIIELKKEISNIIDCYNSIIKSYNPKESEIIINHFNINYLYKLIIKFETNLKKVNIILNIVKCIIDDINISIKEKIRQIEDKKKDLILLHQIVDISYKDIITKCNDIY
jgi:hypothetical protein